MFGDLVDELRRNNRDLQNLLIGIGDLLASQNSNRDDSVKWNATKQKVTEKWEDDDGEG